MERVKSNPLLEPFTAPRGVPPFDRIESIHFVEAFDIALKQAYSDVDRITECSDEPSFMNTIEALECAGELLDTVSTIFFNLNSACTSPEMQKIAQQISPELSRFSMYVSMNDKLFERVKRVKEGAEELDLEQTKLLDNTWSMFVRGGSDLKGENRKRFQEISERLSILSLQFSENSLADTNAFNMHITDESQLSGLPDGVVQAAADEAKERGVDGWVFTLHAPSYMPFMKYADNRELREKMFRARGSICFHGDEHDNRTLISEIVSLRLERAKLLGYDNYAQYALERRMAETPEKVNAFLDELLNASHPAALRDRDEVISFAQSLGFTDELQKWDWAYYSNKLKVARYNLDDEMLRPYFELSGVIDGVFGLATKLYGVTFVERSDMPKYHEDVKVFDVFDADGSFLAVLYTDFFPRSNKDGGAWMTEYRGQRVKDGFDVRPVVSLVMNFTKPIVDKPSLLTFGEVTTFLHEFGHALHGIFSKCRYGSLAGTNVMRDFVELPSQLMENWAFQSEWLDSWAKHYQTGEKLPGELIERIKRSAHFQSGYQCDRQLSFGIVDMAWHSLTESFVGDVSDFEQQAMASTSLMPDVSGTCFCTDFSHIFAGGYAAGYYSYKWAEVLDADAFSLFVERGIFNRDVAESFRRNVLERGGTEHAMTLYERFRGSAPSIDALLRRDGLIGN
ncbi:MAG: M3 family metallopeptidase [Marinifilaceae bacterium]|nr:M3 family metallopeptidase [Marinifilaceae bacterium]